MLSEKKTVVPSSRILESSNPLTNPRQQGLQIIDNRPNQLIQRLVSQLGGGDDDDEKAKLTGVMHEKLRILEDIIKTINNRQMETEYQECFQFCLSDQGYRHYMQLSAYEEMNKRLDCLLEECRDWEITHILTFFDRLSPFLINDHNLELLRDKLKYSLSGDWGMDVFCLSRLCRLSDNIVESSNMMLRRLNKDWPIIVTHFLPSVPDMGELEAVEFTGSDFHNGGQSVCIVSTTKGVRFVYKPRSVIPDMLIFGQGDSCLKFFADKQLQTAPQFPGPGLMSYLPGDDKRQGEEYGYMQFIEHRTRISEQEERAYYFHLGQITVYSKLLGILDLHQDNIMVSDKGQAYPIDAEVAFWPSFILNPTVWAGSCMQKCLKLCCDTSEAIEDMTKIKATANFYLPSSQEQNPDILLHDVYMIEERRRRNIACEKKEPFYKYFKEGVKSVIDILQKNLAGYKVEIRKYYEQLQTVRIVPVATQAFNCYFNRTTPRTQKQELDTLYSEFQVYMNKQNCEETLDKDSFIRLLLDDLNQGDIPLFYYLPHEDEIVLHRTPVARVKVKLVEAMDAAADSLAVANPEKIADTVFRLPPFP